MMKREATFCAALLFVSVITDAAEIKRAAEPLVDVAKACPGIVIELRYATRANGTGHAIYPANARCMVRASVSEHLRSAQALLRAREQA
jgi:D-alanyl-D-alanine dipeptidase